VEKGEIVYFRSDGKEGPLTLDHIMASGSLPPPFPQTEIKNKTDNKKRAYWDGGLSDNTPLGAVLDELDKLEGAADGERTVYVVNLFPKEAPVPQNMIEIMARMKNLQFVNKTEQDVKLMCRFNQVAALNGGIGRAGRGQSAQGSRRLQTITGAGV
jgi:NTE family protein